MNRLKKGNTKELKDLIDKKNISFPKFTIVVPARNEADVVKNTVINLTKLNYPKDSFEIIIVTDEKETINAKENQITTQMVVDETIKEIKNTDSLLAIKKIDVPYDFDGEFGGKLTGREIKSTKGRALNYVFTIMFDYFNKNTDFFAFFDTDDHPDKNCLQEIAKEHLKFPHKKVFQMPVFQCRNF